MGDAMDLSEGVFTVPQAGVYHFHASELSDRGKHFYIYLRVNGEHLAEAYADSRGSKHYASGSLDSTLHLDKGDKVDLLFIKDYARWIIFTGWLDEEDLLF